MSKKILTVAITFGTLLALSITSMAAYYQAGYNSGTKTETVYVYANGTGTYTANALARVEDASNNSLGYHKPATKTISGNNYLKAEYKSLSGSAHHGYYEASAQNVSVGADHFSISGRDY
ncbi:MAG: hypothetical protein IKQ44_10500 [Lachnospiraceae bacterium]|nr:hypothetical protein [Lachnospiraceae bacterium]